jgi:hypothetical protein
MDLSSSIVAILVPGAFRSTNVLATVQCPRFQFRYQTSSDTRANCKKEASTSACVSYSMAGEGSSPHRLLGRLDLLSLDRFHFFTVRDRDTIVQIMMPSPSQRAQHTILHGCVAHVVTCFVYRNALFFYPLRYEYDTIPTIRYHTTPLQAPIDSHSPLLPRCP